MKNIIEDTPKESIFYEDNNIVVALAHTPITQGHSIVIWKKHITDLHLLDRNDYEYLMNAVDVTRNVLQSFFKIEKVYLFYLDEINWVHWHLIPRYDEKGFNILSHNPKRIHKFKNTKELSEIFKQKKKI